MILVAGATGRKSGELHRRHVAACAAPPQNHNLLVIYYRYRSYPGRGAAVTRFALRVHAPQTSCCHRHINLKIRLARFSAVP